jgi:hypothetical protein
MFVLSYYKIAHRSFGMFVIKLLALKYKRKCIFNNRITPTNLENKLQCCFLGRDILCYPARLYNTAVQIVNLHHCPNLSIL